MTCLWAACFALGGHGILVVGNDADNVIFYPVTVIDEVTYEHPMQASHGIDWVIING